MRPGIIYYTDCQLDPDIFCLCRDQLLLAAGGMDIQAISLGGAAGFGAQTIMYGERSIVQMHRQILMGLERSKADYVFLCEHDVLYHPSHFEIVPPRSDTFYYNVNVWKVRWPDGHAVWTDDCQQVSGVCASRALLVSFYQQRIAQIASAGFNRHYEPGLKQTVGGSKVENWQSTYANLDIRHGGNLTRTKWAPGEFRNARYARGWKEADSVEGWGRVADVLKVTV